MPDSGFRDVLWWLVLNPPAISAWVAGLQVFQGPEKSTYGLFKSQMLLAAELAGK